MTGFYWNIRRVNMQEIMNTQDIMKMTKKELNEIPYYKDEGTWFNGFIVVPMSSKHDTGWQAMKFVLLQDRTIVSCIGGASDNIILCTHNWYIDCLPKSKLLRFYNIRRFNVSDISCFSDFIPLFY